jgi:ribosomal protein S21
MANGNNYYRKYKMAKKAVNVEVSLKDVGGDVNRLIRKFVKKVKKERIIEDYLDKRFYTKPSVKRRRQKIAKLQNARIAEAERSKQTKK